MPFVPTKAQASAIQIPVGTIVVSAGAGTGKTSVLAETVAREMVAGKKVPVSNLLVLTFTRKATGEMSERIEGRLIELARQSKDENERSRLMEEASGVANAAIETIDAFAARVLREYGAVAGIDPGFTILDEIDSGILGEKVARDCIKRWLENPPHSEWVRVISETNESDWPGVLNQLDAKIATRGELCDSLILLGKSNVTSGSRENILSELEAEFRAELDKVRMELLSGMAGFMRDLKETSEEKTSNYTAKAAKILEDTDDLGEWLKRTPLDWKQAIIEKISDWEIWNYSKNASASRESARVFARKIRNQILNKIDDNDRDKATLRGIQLDIDLLAHRHAVACALRDFHDEHKKARQKVSGFSFADCELEALKIISEHDDVRRKIRDKYQYIVVDEFQDINPLQRDFIFTMARKQNEKRGLPENLYVVGDERQSIYGFRNADNRIICDLRAEASKLKGDGAGSRILYDSFRSRPEILNLVNHVFRSAWRDKSVHADLKSAGDLYTAEGDLPDIGGIEVHLVKTDDAKSGKLMEASVIADRLDELVRRKKSQVWYRLDGKPHNRDITFSDCAVLVRKRAEFAAFEEEFGSRGIPCVTEGGSGFWSRSEISDIRALLGCLSGSKNNLSAAILLRSPWVGMSDDSLMQIAENSARDDDWLEIADDIEFSNETDGRKWAEFSAWFERLEPMSGQVHVSRLIEHALTGSGYIERMYAEENGDQARANIEKLLFELRSKRSMFSVYEAVECIRWLKETDAAESPAGVGDGGSGELTGGVTIATIHRAKGLEWHLVALPHLNRRKPGGPEADQITWSDSHGLNLRWIEPRSGESWNSTRLIRAAEVQRTFEIDEEMRLLYVALTRARERLILSASMHVKEKDDDVSWKISRRTPVNFTGSWLNILNEAFGDKPDELIGIPDVAGDEILNFSVADPREPGTDPGGPLSPEKRGTSLLIERTIHDSKKGKAPASDTSMLIEEKSIELEQLLKKLPLIPKPDSRRYITSATEIAAWEKCPRMYKYRSIMNVPPRMSEKIPGPLSIGRGGETDEISDAEHHAVEQFELPASEWGLICHRILELTPFKAGIEEIQTISCDACREFSIDPDAIIPPGYLNSGDESQTYAGRLANLIHDTLKLPVFDRIRKMPDENIFREFRLLGRIGTVGQVIHGTIDLACQASDGAVLLDYKSGRVRDEESRANEYGTQLSLYSILAADRFSLEPGKIERHVIFLDPPSDILLPSGPGELDRIHRLLEKFQADSRDNALDATPSEKVCRWCDYADICRWTSVSGRVDLQS